MSHTLSRSGHNWVVENWETDALVSCVLTCYSPDAWCQTTENTGDMFYSLPRNHPHWRCPAKDGPLPIHVCTFTRVFALGTWRIGWRGYSKRRVIFLSSAAVAVWRLYPGSATRWGLEGGVLRRSRYDFWAVLGISCLLFCSLLLDLVLMCLTYMSIGRSPKKNINARRHI